MITDWIGLHSVLFLLFIEAGCPFWKPFTQWYNWKTELCLISVLYSLCIQLSLPFLPKLSECKESQFTACPACTTPRIILTSLKKNFGWAGLVTVFRYFEIEFPKDLTDPLAKLRSLDGQQIYPLTLGYRTPFIACWVVNKVSVLFALSFSWKRCHEVVNQSSSWKDSLAWNPSVALWEGQCHITFSVGGETSCTIHRTDIFKVQSSKKWFFWVTTKLSHTQGL